MSHSYNTSHFLYFVHFYFLSLKNYYSPKKQRQKLLVHATLHGFLKKSAGTVVGISNLYCLSPELLCQVSFPSDLHSGTCAFCTTYQQGDIWGSQ